MVDPLSSDYAYNSVYAFQENKFGKGVELEGAELKEFGEWLGKKVDQVLSWTDVDDVTVVVTNVTRGGNAVHIDGQPATDSDKVFAAGGLLLPAVSGAAVKKIGGALIDNAVDAMKNRVKLQKGTKEAIKEAGRKTKDGRFIDPNTQKPIEKGQEVYGHKTGQEWSKYKKDPANQEKTRKEVIKDQNDPNIYQIEDKKTNASHKYEEKIK
ncbi:GH-E family nuclease [Lacihabitans lacunae]|uniref:GH-E family nuclease n=1 Tax=Lacihabitans lacunae TaxID=1028214 RepID=A0ABV7Z2D3_9BACT